MSGGEWFHVEAGRQAGPVSFEELRDRAVRGDLERPDLVWTEGMAEWQAAETVPGLFEGVEESPAPTPPTYRPGIAPPRPAARGTPGLVIWGFVLSIVGFVTCQVFAVVGLVLCAVGIPEAKRRGAGVGLAIAGIIIAICGLLFVVGMITFSVLAA